MDELPPLLQKLIDALTGIVAKATLALQNAPDTVEEWQAAMEINLARYHLAAYMAGAGSPDLTPEAKAAVVRRVQSELEFLNNFALEIQNAEEWQAGWNARAASYARAIKEPYWRGKTKMLPLPAMPADGTQCHNNCKCQWDISEVEPDVYSCTWVRHASDSCQTCVARAAEWSPLIIRNGVLE